MKRERNTGSVADAAAEWIVRLSEPAASAEDRRAFVAWLKRSPVHLEEYLQAERTWAELGEVDPQRRLNVAELLARPDPNIVELAGSTMESRPPMEGPSARRPARLAAYAAAAGILVALAGLSLWNWLPTNDYVTAVGEQRQIKLADGSSVVLNTGTRLHVGFTRNVREVRLERGEALFNVEKDPKRPFRVVSDRAIVQAVGTSFVVRRQADQTVVTVIEGVVAVARPSEVRELSAPHVPASVLRVAAGRRADVADRKIETSVVKNPVSVTAWRSGRLIFDGSTLAQAVAEFNRYNDVQLVLEDPVLSGERVSGVFASDHPQALVHFLEHSGVIEPARSEGGRIILVPRR